MSPSSPPNFDPVEVARGALAFLAFTTARAAHEVHISRIQEVFSRSAQQQALIPALKALSNLREAERLEHGYWLPAPSRRVSLDAETCMLVSIAPTHELQRNFPSVRRAGLGRLADPQQVMALPCQSLQSWLGTGSTDAAAWTRTQIESAISKLEPSIASSELEVFSVKATRMANHGWRREPVWLPSTDRRACVWRDIKLFRSRVSGSYHRYFLGRISGNSTLFEGPAAQENFGLQYGLAALLGQALTSFVVSKGNLRYLRLPLTVPRSARRALEALCEPDPKSFGYRWTCRHAEGWPTVRAVLKDLGCEIENNE